MRILLLTDQFYPESNAGASRSLGHSRAWTESGESVTVITGVPNFPKGQVFSGYKNKLLQRESLDGIKIVRVWTFIARNAGFLKRILDFASFAITSFFAGLLQKTDVIVVTSPQFLVVFSAYALSLVKRVPWVFEVRDLWPESIAGLGWMSEKSLVYRMLEKSEIFLYHKASKIIVVTEYFKRDLIKRGIPAEKIEIVENGIDIIDFQEVEASETLKERIDLPGTFIVGYVGTLGEAQDFDFILSCAKELEDEVTFLFVGDGSVREKIIENAAQLNLKNVVIKGMVPRSEVKNYLGAADLSLICLKPIKAFEKVIPSKIFESAVLGKPVLLGASGQAREFVLRNEIGVFFDQSDRQGFIAAVRKYKTSPEAQLELKAACKRFSDNFHRSKMAKLALAVLFSTIKSKTKCARVEGHTT